MADLVSIADGNASAAASWGLVDTTSRLVSNSTSVTALTTGNLDSAAFTPGAITVSGVCVKLGTMVFSSVGTSTFTVILRNSTAGSDVASVVIRKNAMVESFTAVTGDLGNGGWIYCKFSANQTLLAATNYVIRITASDTTGALSLYTNGTANNWQHLLVTTTTQAPAAGDDMHGMGVCDGSASPVTAIGARAHTWDITAATDFGAGATGLANSRAPAYDLSRGYTLTWGTTAATNYVMRLSGWMRLYNGSTLNMGTTGTPCPRDSTMQLEFDCGADADFGLHTTGSCVFNAQGQSRTSGKNVSVTLLTADAAAAATSLTVADDTGWLSGDEIGIAPTSRTATQGETNALTGNATASTLAVSALAVLKAGNTAAKCQAEIILLTRNVVIRSVSSTFMAYIRVLGTGSGPSPVYDWDWVAVRYCGSTAGNEVGALNLDSIQSGYNCAFTHVVIRESDRTGLGVTGTNTGVVTFTDLSVWRFGVANIGFGVHFFIPTFTQLWTFTRTTICALNATSPMAGWYSQAQCFNISIDTLRVSGCYYGFEHGGGNGSTLGNGGLRPFNNFYIHSCASVGFYFDATAQGNYRWTGEFYLWRCGFGLYFGSSAVGTIGLEFDCDTYLYGITNGGMSYTNATTNATFRYLMCAGDTSFAQPYGIDANGANATSLTINRGDFGVASGIWVAHATADVRVTSCPWIQWIFRRVRLSSSTPTSGTSAINNAAVGSHISFDRRDGTVDSHSCLTPMGTIAYETSTVQSSPGMKMTPNILATSQTLQSPQGRLATNGGRMGRGFMVGVESGNTVQVSVYVRKDASYNGDQPRLVQKSNGALSLNTDVVLATMTVAHSNWEILTGTTAAVDDDGVIEFVVECNGSAGSVYVNQWTSGSATPSGNEKTWLDGLPFQTAGASAPSAGATGTSRARVQRGM